MRCTENVLRGRRQLRLFAVTAQSVKLRAKRWASGIFLFATHSRPDMGSILFNDYWGLFDRWGGGVMGPERENCLCLSVCLSVAEVRKAAPTHVYILWYLRIDTQEQFYTFTVYQLKNLSLSVPLHIQRMWRFSSLLIMCWRMCVYRRMRAREWVLEHSCSLFPFTFMVRHMRKI